MNAPVTFKAPKFTAPAPLGVNDILISVSVPTAAISTAFPAADPVSTNPLTAEETVLKETISVPLSLKSI